MVHITKLLFLALTAAATPILRRDVIEVEHDITQRIGPQYTKLNDDINGFPASGLQGAFDIHVDFLTLVATVHKTISDIKSTGRFGTVPGTTILADVQALVPTISASLVALGSQEPTWAALPGGRALVLSDLQNLSKAMNNFMDAVAVAEPTLLKAGAVAVQTQIDGDFTTAIAAYSD